MENIFWPHCILQEVLKSVIVLSKQEKHIPFEQMIHKLAIDSTFYLPR